LAARRKTTLQVTISAAFALLILPALGTVIAFSYYANARNLKDVAQRSIDRARDEAIATTVNFFEPVAATLRLIAEVATTDPGYFRAEQSRNTLYDAVISAPQIDAVYTSFDDGYHRVVTRIDEDRRRNDPRIPARANWHSSYIDAHGPGVQRMRHRTFFETWPQPIGGYAEDSRFEVQTMPQYQGAQRTLGPAISDPIINPDTGYPIISMGYPIFADGKFGGAASANITMHMLSTFLETHRASPNSITLIADGRGNVVAYPVAAQGLKRSADNITMAKLSELPSPQVVKAAELRQAGRADRFTFDLPVDGREYVALFSKIPSTFIRDWVVVVVTPTDDFVGALKQTNRELIWLMVGLVLAESFLIYFMARRISRPIEIVSQAIGRIRTLTFGQLPSDDSAIREISQLQGATILLANALRSFAVFVPVGLVRGLIEAGKPLAPAVETRFMTILFTDVANFTTISEQLSPERLSEQTSRYFEAVTGAVSGEKGTIDKFIGDSVMAFWGAPAALDDHVFLACCAALRADRRMRRLNADWTAEGRPPMPVRIGVHCAEVVVGNVGSPQRLSYTVMGDGVNVASRLEGLNKQFGTSICISDSVHERVAGRIVARPLERVAVKGRHRELVVYELLGIAGSDDPELTAA
jgi:class 3 adenylate cyclase